MPMPMGQSVVSAEVFDLIAFAHNALLTRQMAHTFPATLEFLFVSRNLNARNWNALLGEVMT